MTETEKKTRKIKDKKEELEFKSKHIAELSSKLQIEADKYTQKYINFLNNCKTE